MSSHTDAVTLHLSPRISLILALLEADGRKPIYGRTRLVKMLFLLQEAIKKESIEFEDMYDFRPLHYGPFAFE